MKNLLVLTTMLLSTAVSRGATHVPIIGYAEVLHCSTGFYDHFNKRYINEYDLIAYSDLSFSLTANVLYGAKISGWGKLMDDSTIEFVQDIGFGRRTKLGMLSVDATRTHAKLTIDQTNREADLICKIEQL